jgi:hypothetical protein
MVAPPGWYSDPGDPTRERWWDGRRWAGGPADGPGGPPPLANHRRRAGPVPGRGQILWSFTLVALVALVALVVFWWSGGPARAEPGADDHPDRLFALVWEYPPPAS